MTKNIISTFSIYDATGKLITSGLQLTQAMAIKAYAGVTIKFTGFIKVVA